VYDETPNVRADELDLRFPDPEPMFMASSDAEWRETRDAFPPGNATSHSVALTLSSLFFNVDSPVPLPQTLMGRFVVLHGK
jgi:hypothetical protein